MIDNHEGGKASTWLKFEKGRRGRVHLHCLEWANNNFCFVLCSTDCALHLGFSPWLRETHVSSSCANWGKLLNCLPAPRPGRAHAMHSTLSLRHYWGDNSIQHFLHMGHWASLCRMRNSQISRPSETVLTYFYLPSSFVNNSHSHCLCFFL